MSDRGFLFLFSVLMITGGIGAAAWLGITGQAGTVDGLFMVLTALLIAAAFAMYLLFMIRRAMQPADQPAVKPAKAGAGAAAAKPAPATVAQE